jgi:hypothetical protein
MQMKIKQTPHTRLLVSAALLEKLVFGSGFEIAPTPPFALISGMQEEAVSSSVAPAAFGGNF